jgi:hypothetical protein
MKHRHFKESNHLRDSQQIIDFYKTSSSGHNSEEKQLTTQQAYVENLLVVMCDWEILSLIFRE